MKHKLLGRLGVWLCNRNFPRPCTNAEAAQTQQYVRLVIDVLKGNCRDYGRDREENHTPVVAERVDYAKIYR
jgi:hypothetical protein